MLVKDVKSQYQEMSSQISKSCEISVDLVSYETILHYNQSV